MTKRKSRIDSIAVRLKETEEELRLLRRHLEEESSKGRPKRFPELYGIWKGKSDFTYEEIEEAEIKLRDEL